MGKTQKKKQPQDDDVLELRYRLGELPSSHHRAGLAGLALMCDWLKRIPDEHTGVCEISQLGKRGATLRVDRDGMASLFDQVYKATITERESKVRYKGKKPLREETRKVTSEKTGKATSKTVYIYPECQPDGVFLNDWDPSASEGSGLWVKLWRDMVWSILRGVPATRRPFEFRAKGKAVKDAQEAWVVLRKKPDSAVDLPSTYCLGAQAKTAEEVAFRDRARFQFLLHFWPFVAQIYVPVALDRDRKRSFVGYAIAMPDVANLRLFCEKSPYVMKARGEEVSGYRPRGALVDIPAAGGLEVLAGFRTQLAQRESDWLGLVSGIDVFHMNKQGNNIRMLTTLRVDPKREMVDAYVRIRTAYHEHLVRSQRLTNLINNEPWHNGFDRLLSTTPSNLTIESRYFRRDVRTALELEANCGGTMEQQEQDELAEPSVERIIYRLVGRFLAQKLGAKHDLSWNVVKDKSDEEKDKYNTARQKIAKHAFLATRSRTGSDFVDYFTATLCSVPQFLPEEDYVYLSQQLFTEPDTVRTLTLLALCARA